MNGTEPRKDHVKIGFFREPEDGYPPEEWENMWAIPLGGNRFRLDNIPFYAFNVSYEDILEASDDEGMYIFSKVVYPSENSTVRLVVYDVGAVAEIRNMLEEFGCAVEGSGIPGLLAVNIPQRSLDETMQYIRFLNDEDQIDYEEGAIRYPTKL